MRRLLVLTVCASVLAVVPAAEASSCLLAIDPSGDAGHSIPDETGPQHDIVRLMADVTPTTVVFRTTVKQVRATTPPPLTGDVWSVWFMTPRGEIRATVHRSYSRDSGSVVGAEDRDPPPFDASFRIDARTSTVSIDVPYARAGLRRGDRLTSIRAYAGPFRGVDARAADEDRRVGSWSLADNAGANRRVVVGVGCS